MEKIISIEVLFLSIDIFVSLVLSSRQILLTQLSQATNMLLISNKISINKNKQIPQIRNRPHKMTQRSKR